METTKDWCVAYNALQRLHAKAVARYEYVRKLNPQQFTKLWTHCLIDDKRFDDAVDEAILCEEKVKCA